MRRLPSSPPPGRQVALSGFRFGLSFHWLPINTVVLQVQVAHLVGRQHQGSGVGLLFALGTVFAVGVPPLVGAVSDRIWTRAGRRRPLMAAATLVDLAGLGLMFSATSYAQLLAGYLVAQLATNAAGAAYNGLIPDSVPVADFGRMSGFIAAMAQVGQVASLLGTLVLATRHALLGVYVLIGVVLLLSLLPSLAAGLEQPPRADKGPPQPLLRRVVQFIRPITGGDFTWVFLTRLSVTCGINAVSPFLLPFFRDVIGVAHPEQFTPVWLLTVLVVATPFALAGGSLSDRFGRKRFVYAAGCLQGLVALVFLAFYPSHIWEVLLLAGTFGIGYGLFYSVDAALALDTLPDPARSAKDLGLMHIAETVPGVFVPGAGGFLLDVLNHQSMGMGYRAVFGGAAVFFVLGGLLVRNVRSVS